MVVDTGVHGGGLAAVMFTEVVEAHKPAANLFAKTRDSSIVVSEIWPVDQKP